MVYSNFYFKGIIICIAQQHVIKRHDIFLFNQKGTQFLENITEMMFTLSPYLISPQHF